MQTHFIKLSKLILNVLEIRPGEKLPLALLIIHSFLSGITIVFLETTANTLFLKEFSVSTLPYVYIASAIVATILGIFYVKLEKRLSPEKLLLLTLIFLSVCIAGFHLSIKLYFSKGIVLSLMISKDVIWVLANLELWAVSGLIFNVRQGKRLFGLIVTGQIVACILAGFSIPLLVRHIGTPNLLLISTVGIVAALVVLVFITRLCEFSTDRQTTKIETRTSLNLSKNRYLELFFIISVLSYLGYYIIDYIFYDKVSNNYKDETHLASFFGVFYAVLFIIQLLSTFTSGPLITRFGLGFALLALPFIDSLGAALGIVSIGFSGFATVFFIIIVMTKLIDEVLRTTVEAPAFHILYQPLPVSQRLQVQTMREILVEPIAIGFSGIIILMFTSFLSLESIHLLIIFLLLAAIWIYFGALLRKEYTAKLLQALSKRKLGEIELLLNDRSSLSVLLAGLKSSNPGEIIYSLSMLEVCELESLSKFYIELIEHESPEVREYVLHKIANISEVSIYQKVINRLEVEKSPRVKGVAIQTLCKLKEDEAFEQISPYLEDENQFIIKGALCGLLRHGGIDGVLIAGTKLNYFLQSKDKLERQLAAEILGDVGISSFYRPLVSLLQDDAPIVRCAALTASGKLKNIKLFGTLHSVSFLFYTFLSIDATKTYHYFK